MAKSIMQRGSDWDFCYICGRNHTADPCGLETHHVFGGANRCHRNGKDAVHKNKTIDMAIKAAGQKIFESECGSHDDFMRIFGKNYI